MILEKLWPELPEGYSLKQALLTTYDFDWETLKSLPIDLQQPEKYLIFFDNTQTDLSENVTEYIPFRKMLVKTSSDEKKAAAVHGKIWLFLYESASGSRKWHLIIHSTNISCYDNLEIKAELTGTETDRIQPKNGPLIDYLRELTEYLPPEGTDDEKRLRFDQIISGLEKVQFTPLQEYACEDHDFLIPRTDGAAFLFQPYDELLVVSPFIQREELNGLIECGRENASCTVLSNVETIRCILKEGPAAARLIPFGDLKHFVHAKVYLRRIGTKWELCLGSMNLKATSMRSNLEIMVRMVNPQRINSIPGFLEDYLLTDKQNLKQWTEDEGAIQTLFNSPIFRKAALQQTRQTYLCHMLNRSADENEEQNRLVKYILSSACTADLLRLDQGDESLPTVPKHIRTGSHHKERDIFQLPERERHLLSLVNYTLHCFDDRFDPNLYSYILNRVPTKIFSLIRKDPLFRDLYLFRIDVKSYGISIDPDILMETLAAFLKQEPAFHDPVFLAFADRLVHRRSCIENGALVTDSSALQPGVPINIFFENVYLFDLDLEISKKAAFYARFADDILIGAETLPELEHLIKDVNRIMRKKKLQLNHDKSLILEPGTPFTFLGYQIRGSRIDFTPETLSQIEKLIRGETQKMLITCKKAGLSREFRLMLMVRHARKLGVSMELKKAFRVVSVPDGLRKIDGMLYDMIRTVVTGKTGNGRFRVTREEINSWGYQSLVNSYYRCISGMPYQDMDRLH